MTYTIGSAVALVLAAVLAIHIRRLDTRKRHIRRRMWEVLCHAERCGGVRRWE